MTQHFTYSSKYILDKRHFNECFTQSVKAGLTWRDFFKPMVLGTFGLLLLLFSDVTAYAAWFIVALGAVEGVSIRFRQIFWVTRQMMGKSAGGEVTLEIDEQGLSIKSFYVAQMILWQEITILEKSPLGWIIIHSQGKSYLSDEVLSAPAKIYLEQQQKKIQSKVLTK
jgi:hypothetical protein